MYEILKYEHGYSGSYGSVAKCVRELKFKVKVKQREVYIPLTYGAGEAFQFDWADMQVYIGDELLSVQLALVTLCHSQRFYLSVNCKVKLTPLSAEL